ncbi:hypothetical protein GUY44_03105 [Pimelobacter simplex]|uniref:Uncharacterized protein n=1 Tax=Nocardioides simplex TaxID=2045 RepID=A0A0A1DPM7_NOCSI|nr:hypothetical protein [Pimelobacter simplex]AIY19334.1 hypothetical protein KR76_25800 [Pimelobacter simplex]MCG8149452.1 hypothetical protein [Pimelobacter simplex]GEB16176.1 hypothetical protein NSI01_44910 [Pimelobacter simplex]SFM18892.1 hypothetical protein SAMN05421671_0170 [Pimelobacter simplex]
MSTTQSPGVTDYRLAPPIMARFVGAYLILLAVVLLVVTGLVAVLELNADLLVVVLALGLLGLIGLSWWLRSRLVVVRLTDAGYRVRAIRAAGVTEARWAEVEDAVAAAPSGVECVVLRLRDGRSTTIPVQLVAGDKDDFARDVRDHLERAAR